MKKTLFVVLFICVSSFLYPQAFEEVSGEEFGLDEINNRKTYLEIADEVKNIFLEIDDTLNRAQSKIDISIDNYNLYDLNSADFSSLKLSDQLKLFQQNYNSLNNFTLDSMQLIQENDKVFEDFCGLQIKLMNTFGQLLDESDRIQKSQEEDLNNALYEIKKAQSSTESLKQNLEVCKTMANQQAKKIKRLQNQRIWLSVGIGVGAVVGGFVGYLIYNKK